MLTFALFPGTNTDKRRTVLEAWYRNKLKDATPSLIAKWEKLAEQKMGYDLNRNPCFKWSGREDLNLRPPAPKARE